MKYTTISIKLRSPKGEIVDGIIVVRDNFALSTFSDKKLARQLYEYDKERGEDVAFNEELNAYIQKYNNKKMKEIIKKITEELEKAGGKVTSKNEG
jgi:hypothetical protein